MEYARILDELTTKLASLGGSDLHFSAFRPPFFRVSGVLSPVTEYPLFSPEDSMNTLFAMIDDEEKKAFLQNKELDFSYSTKAGVRFRGNAFFQKGFVGIALRLVPSRIRTLDELLIPPVVAEFAKKKQGFFLVVGPVGQGKSTTLAAMVDMINHERAEHILTIEDPMEYVYKEDKSIIDQREVRFDTDDFPGALRSMFRQDINVALIGEMRDPETISTAVTAAETGHLILSTLHTNNAAQTVDRIIDSFPSHQQGQIKIQLAGTLLGIFSQRLLPRVSGGLIPAYELLINNSAVANLIREGRTAELNVVIETSSELGMVDMNHCLARMVDAGEITRETAFMHSLNPKSLERMI